MKKGLLAILMIFPSLIGMSQKANTERIPQTGIINNAVFPMSYEVIDEAYDIIYLENIPEFPGGQDSLSRFFKSNLYYPDSTKAHGLSGTVHVEFDINMVGAVVDAKIIKGLDTYTEEICLQTVWKMPLWTHGDTKRTGAIVRFHLPVKFVLKD